MKNYFYLIVILFLFLFYVLSNINQIRFDLTSDKRYSLSNSSIDIIRNLDNPVKFEIFISGELPSGIMHLKSSINRMMMDIKYYNKQNIKYEFVDIDEFDNDKKEVTVNRLLSYGINPTDLVYNSNKGRIFKRIFPGMLITIGNNTKSILLLKGDNNYNASELLSQSVENLEYEIISNLFFLNQEKNKKIGLVIGHDELDSLDIQSFKFVIEKKYFLKRLNINESFNSIDEFELLIIAKPKSPFSYKEKFFIDQFLMKGGKILFLIDALGVDLEKSSGDGTLAYEYNHDLDDILYKYGVRINKDYVKDFNSGLFPVVVGDFANAPNIVSLPFPYFPEISNYGDHSIVRNLGSVLTKFVSSIDTVNNLKNIKKTPLIWTSKYSLIDNFPVLIRLNDLGKISSESDYNSGSKIIGILLEGKFTSFFKNRIIDFKIGNKNFIQDGKNSKIIIISDGDIIRNDIVNNKPMDLGNDYYQKKKYANKDLVRNILFYLLEDEELINTRLKNLNYYQLDKSKINTSKVFYQWTNLLLPIAFFFIIFILRYLYREKKYNLKN